MFTFTGIPRDGTPMLENGNHGCDPVPSDMERKGIQSDGNFEPY
jgi:hypothetical protein